jgi:hypothetical protein
MYSSLFRLGHSALLSGRGYDRTPGVTTSSTARSELFLTRIQVRYRFECAKYVLQRYDASAKHFDDHNLGVAFVELGLSLANPGNVFSIAASAALENCCMQ